MKVRTCAIAMSVAAALLAGLAGCGPSGGPEQSAPEVGFVTIVAKPVHLTAELPGRTAPYAISEVRPQITGIVEKRLFTEGSQVKAGDTLYQIDPKPYQAAYDSAVAGLATARSLAKRYKALLTLNAIAPQSYDDAEAAYLKASAAVETARINLDYTQVKAPISGRIGISAVTAGALVTANQATALTTIQTLDPIYVDITQSSTQLLRLKQDAAKGQLNQNGPMSADVSLTLEDGTRYDKAGKLQFTDVTVDPGTGTVTLRALFPNPDHLLLPGMYVRAVISEGTDPHAILAPQQGVARDAKGEPTALVVGKDGKVAERVLTVSRAIGSDWLVTSGLKSGDRLIVEGTQKARPGMAVHAVAADLGTENAKPAPMKPKPGH